jgi:hypothetical protein
MYTCYPMTIVLALWHVRFGKCYLIYLLKVLKFSVCKCQLLLRYYHADYLLSYQQFRKWSPYCVLLVLHVFAYLCHKFTMKICMFVYFFKKKFVWFFLIYIIQLESFLRTHSTRQKYFELCIYLMRIRCLDF